VEEKKVPERRTIIRSPLSQRVADGAVTVRVEISKAADADAWTLEQIDGEGNVTVWLEVFETDEQAFAAFTERLGNPTLSVMGKPANDNLPHSN
jgi:hypothetical protein